MKDKKNKSKTKKDAESLKFKKPNEMQNSSFKNNDDLHQVMTTMCGTISYAAPEILKEKTL